MKKLMVLAAVAMAGLGLRAATADWSFDTYIDDQFGSGVPGGAIAFYCGTDLMGTAESDGGVFKYDFTDVAGGSSWKAVMTVGLTDNGETFTQYSKAFEWTMPSFAGGGDPADASALAGVNDNIMLAFVDPGAGALPTLTDAKTQGWVAVATPEPTSGLLLLLGFAGLALRRRRA